MDLNDMIADRFGRVEGGTNLRRTRKTSFYSLGHILTKTPSAPTRGFGQKPEQSLEVYFIMLSM
jgi:hypothetical protein